jgi:hypothetical protein
MLEIPVVEIPARYRASFRLREKTRVPPRDLTRLWLGHSKESVTDYYAGGLKNDSAWRQEWAERVGLGFSLNGLLGLQNVVPIDSAKVA